MALPANFSGYPTEEPHHHFRNICIEFKKAIHSAISSPADIAELEQQMDGFINMSKQMDWHHKNTGVYHKDVGDKAVNKVRKEFDRYIQALQSHTPTANPQLLLDALSEVEQLIKRVKAA